MNVYLTKKGKILAPVIYEIMKNYHNHIKESIGKENLQKLTELLESLNTIHS